MRRSRNQLLPFFFPVSIWYVHISLIRSRKEQLPNVQSMSGQPQCSNVCLSEKQHQAYFMIYCSLQNIFDCAARNWYCNFGTVPMSKDVCLTRLYASMAMPCLHSLRLGGHGLASKFPWQEGLTKLAKTLHAAVTDYISARCPWWFEYQISSKYLTPFSAGDALACAGI